MFYFVMCFLLALSFDEFIQKLHSHFNVRMHEEAPHYIVCEMKY